MEDNELTYSEEEEQNSLQLSLEEEKDDKACQLFNVEECWEEDKLEEELAGDDTMGQKDASEEGGDRSDSSMRSSERYLGNIMNTQAMKYRDRVCRTVQRNLKELNDIAKEKEFVIHQVRDNLSTCQLRIKMLAKQLEYVDVETQKEEEAGNVAALSRLQAMHRRLCAELQKEKDFEWKIALALKENTLDMWHIETEQGKYEILHEQLKKDEEELEMQYQERAGARIWREKTAALQAEEYQWSREKKEAAAQKESEERHKKILEDAKKNHEKAVCFLRKSMARIHEKNAKEEAKTREHMERRIQAVLSLKTSITSNREKLRSLQAWNKAMAFEAEKQEMKMREAILAEGGNVAREMLLHKRLLEHEKEKQAYREQQQLRKFEIVSQILQEKASIHKQQRSQSCSKAVKGGGKLEASSRWRMKTWHYIEKSCRHSAGAVSQLPSSPSACSLAGERTASVGETSEEMPHEVLCESDEDEREEDKTLVEPEFPGLWSQECALNKISREEMDVKQQATRVKRKETFEKKMEELKPGISHKQIVSGCDSQGGTFYSKPSCIHFKDFDVGQVYKQKIALINASCSVNSCRLVGTSEWLQDFIRVRFEPPGKMSPGMSCGVVVTFKPMINEALEGEVMFMAQTGSFSVPVKCTPKRCILALDKELIDFGSHVVGERISRTINLTNSGALGTRFRVQMSAGDSRTCRATAKSFPGRMVTRCSSDSSPEEGVSNSPVTSAVQKEQICPNHNEEMSYCITQEEQQGAERSQSDSSTEHLGQDLLNPRSDLDMDNAHDLVEVSPEETPVEIMLGKVTEGEIGPFSSVKLQVLFVPAIPGAVQAEFVIVFDNSDCKPLCFSAFGVSTDVPVWVPNPNIDLKICMYDQLYQDCIVIQSSISEHPDYKPSEFHTAVETGLGYPACPDSQHQHCHEVSGLPDTSFPCVVPVLRAKTTLRLKFEVCKELSKHLELLPKTGYIQAQASFSVQLKFLPRLSVPVMSGCVWVVTGVSASLDSVFESLITDLRFLTRHSLPEDAGSYFNEETRILEVPVTILMVDKARKVHVTVHAIVTTSDLEISPARVDFGYCTIYEAVQANITLTNKSLLPQEFGFVGLPEFVEIQPNDGLGIILPLESLTLDIIFKASKAKEYSFELTCKSEINRQFKLSCKAVGVHPPLELSHSLVQFAATALNSVSTATLYVMNSHVSGNHFTHAVPRIGSGEVAPIGPTSFEFCVPEDCPVTVTPSVGTVLPGKKSLIQVSFRPTLSDQLIREEAARRLCAAAATGAEIQKKKDEKREGKKLSTPLTRKQSSKQLVRDGGSKYLTSLQSSEQPKSEELKPVSDAFMAAQAFLMRNFSGRFDKYIIPCFVASGCTDEKRGSEDLNYSPYNTLYLELHCPAVAPSVVVTSDHGKNTVDFGGVAVGHRMMKQITLQNISPEKLELGFSVLNPYGPFLLVRPVEMLEPGENKTLVISFCPNENKGFWEMLDIWTVKTNLTLRITGHGVMPSIVCSVGEELNMGCVVAREKVTSTFKIQNTSTLTLPYSIQLDSLSPTRDKDHQRLPSFVTSSSQRTDFVGTQNYSGLSVFSVFPTGGEIVAGNSQDFTVMFSPDHESLCYSDRLKVVLFGRKIAHMIHLKGAARNHVKGGIPPGVPTWL